MMKNIRFITVLFDKSADKPSIGTLGLEVHHPTVDSDCKLEKKTQVQAGCSRRILVGRKRKKIESPPVGLNTRKKLRTNVIVEENKRRTSTRFYHNTIRNHTLRYRKRLSQVAGRKFLGYLPRTFEMATVHKGSGDRVDQEYAHIHVDSKKTLKFITWEQTSSEVKITLHAGRHLTEKDVSIKFSDQTVHVGLLDGRQWSCQLYSTVNAAACKFQLKKMRVTLILKKMNSNSWRSYEKNGILEDVHSSIPIEEDLKSYANIQALSSKQPEISSFDSIFRSTKDREVYLNEKNKAQQQGASDCGSLNCHTDHRTIDNVSLDSHLPSSMQTNKMKNTETVDTRSNVPLRIDSSIGLDVKVTDPQTMDIPTSSVETPVNETKVNPPTSMKTLNMDEMMANIALAMQNRQDFQNLPQASGCSLETSISSDSCIKKEKPDLSLDEDVAKKPELDINKVGEMFVSVASSGLNLNDTDMKLLTSLIPQNESASKIVYTEPVKELIWTKQDSYEPNEKLVIVVFYIKNIKAEKLMVEFSERRVDITFLSGSSQFLQMNGGTSETPFHYQADLLYNIIPEKSSYKLKTNSIEMTLVKEVPKKWGSILASSTSSISTPVGSSLSSTSCTPTFSSESGIASSVSTSSLSSSTKMSAGSGDFIANNKFLNTNKENLAQVSNEFESLAEKPTCMVSPLTNLNEITTLSIPTRPIGSVGLENLGNTCFMNSVLQVLANTVELKDYFLEGKHETDLNTENPLGMGGKLAAAFGQLIKILWTSSSSSVSPSKLKNLVAQKQSRFIGYSQHDAEEFMEFLLDGLHEDLNRIKKKPYSEEMQDNSGHPVEVVASEAWRRHKMRNDSHVVDIFQGQYHSKVTCPTCGKVSVTFDPFSVIQVPIPKKKKLLNVVLMSKHANIKPIQYQIQIGLDANVEHLKNLIAKKNTRVQAADLRVMEVNSSNNSINLFNRAASLSKVTSLDQLLVCEVLSEEVAGEPVQEILVQQRSMIPLLSSKFCTNCRQKENENRALKRCTRCYKIAYCGQQCQKLDWERHRPSCRLEGEPVGWPFMISLPRSQVTFRNLCTTAEAFARYSVNVFQPPATSKKVSEDSGSGTELIHTDEDSMGADGPGAVSSPSTDDHTYSSLEKRSPIPSDLDEESSNDAFEQPQGSHPPVRCVLGTQQDPPSYQRPTFNLKPAILPSMLPGNRNLKDQGDESLDFITALVMEWKNNEKSEPHVLVESKKLECEIDDSNSNVNGSSVIQLGDCLTLFTEPEVLSQDQTWYCPKCKLHCQATKEMSLWYLPPTLIIHLKRFSFSGCVWRDKIEDLVEFPVSGLDMSPYYKRRQFDGEPNPIYDLYGVINHHGHLLGGHYYSYARCPHPTDNQKDSYGWRHFDDAVVTSIYSSRVVSKDAYVLFYRRRDIAAIMPSPAELRPIGEKSDVDKMDVDEIDNDDDEYHDTVEELATIDVRSASSAFEDTDIDTVD